MSNSFVKIADNFGKDPLKPSPVMPTPAPSPGQGSLLFNIPYGENVNADFYGTSRIGNVLNHISHPMDSLKGKRNIFPRSLLFRGSQPSVRDYHSPEAPINNPLDTGLGNNNFKNTPISTGSRAAIQKTSELIMNPQEQAYIEGFVKRANEYGFNDEQAIELLKQSNILGEADYTGLDTSGKTPELIEGKGLGAHLKRNSGLYTGGALLGLGGAGMGALSTASLLSRLPKNSKFLATHFKNPALKTRNLKDVYRTLLAHGALGVGALGTGAGMLLGNLNDVTRKEKTKGKAIEQELMKEKGKNPEGYNPSSLQGSGNFALPALAVAGTGAYALSHPKVINGIKNYIKSKMPMSAAEVLRKSNMAKNVIKALPAPR